MSVVEVFRTNVQEDVESSLLVQHLLIHFPESKINFDLDDCDKILRVESANVCIEKIISLLKDKGFCCEVLT